MNTFKKYPKDWRMVIGVLVIGLIAVMGWHWTDTAKTPFWWNFWVWAAIGCTILWIAGWVYLSKKDKAKRQ